MPRPRAGGDPILLSVQQWNWPPALTEGNHFLGGGSGGFFSLYLVAGSIKPCHALPIHFSATEINATKKTYVSTSINITP